MTPNTRPLLAVIIATGYGANHTASRKLIAEAAASAGWTASFPDFGESDTQMDSFIAPFRNADHILADLTGERPSCYFELGLVEAHRLPVTVCAARGTQIHQTSNAGGVRFYDSPDELCGIVIDACRSTC